MELLLYNGPPVDDIFPGAIIDARPDGFVWGTMERVHPFRVIRVQDDDLPGADYEEKRALLVEPLDPHPDDIDSLPPESQANLSMRRRRIAGQQLIRVDPQPGGGVSNQVERTPLPNTQIWPGPPN